MGSKPPQTRKGQQGFPFQTLPHEPETAYIKRICAKYFLDKISCSPVWNFLGEAGVFFLTFYAKNFDYPEKPLKYKHIRRISD